MRLISQMFVWFYQRERFQVEFKGVGGDHGREVSGITCPSTHIIIPVKVYNFHKDDFLL
jgi:hypothetical protein